jgi:glutathione S-transferase
MIELYQFPPVWGLPNGSPFCMKMETWLRMAGLPFRIHAILNPARAPKGKLPYIRDNGMTMADSGLIIDYLKKAYGDKLDSALDPRQRATAHLIRRTLEESLYWSLLYDRWVVDENWAITGPSYFGALPPVVRRVVARLVRRATVRQIYAQGIGRHTRDEVYALGQADLSALAEQLGDNEYFLGAQPTSVDASAYAFIANLLWSPIDSPLTRAAKGHANLVAYAGRMKARYYA